MLFGTVRLKLLNILFKKRNSLLLLLSVQFVPQQLQTIPFVTVIRQFLLTPLLIY